MRSERQNNLKAFVGLHHYPQKRKYTGEPYMVHLAAVAEMADKYSILMGYEIGLCHDLFEDTQCSEKELCSALVRFGYIRSESDLIMCGVWDLTDRYTHEHYNFLNRKRRKELETKRLKQIRPDFQSIKYCDIIDNTKSICQHDPKFAKVYVKEKFDLLQVMDKGNNDLYNLALKSI